MPVVAKLDWRTLARRNERSCYFRGLTALQQTPQTR